MSKLTLIKKPGCAPCAALSAQLDAESIEYRTVDITQSPEAPELIDKYAISSVPVMLVETADGTEVLRGFHPVEAIKTLINEGGE